MDNNDGMSELEQIIIILIALLIVALCVALTGLIGSP